MSFHKTWISLTLTRTTDWSGLLPDKLLLLIFPFRPTKFNYGCSRECKSGTVKFFIRVWQLISCYTTEENNTFWSVPFSEWWGLMSLLASWLDPVLCRWSWWRWTGECSGHAMSVRHSTALLPNLWLLIVSASSSVVFPEPWRMI